MEIHECFPYVKNLSRFISRTPVYGFCEDFVLLHVYLVCCVVSVLSLIYKKSHVAMNTDVYVTEYVFHNSGRCDLFVSLFEQNEGASFFHRRNQNQTGASSVDKIHTI